MIFKKSPKIKSHEKKKPKGTGKKMIFNIKITKNKNIYIYKDQQKKAKRNKSRKNIEIQKITKNLKSSPKEKNKNKGNTKEQRFTFQK